MDIRTYCEAVKYPEFFRTKEDWQRNKDYHDKEYGVPVSSDNALFERLLLEINQAGLSWNLILQKREGFRKSYSDFNISKIAQYGKRDINRLLKDGAIIRNRLKINAAIHNAQVILKLQKEYGSFKKWLDSNKSLSEADWVKLFKKTFKFTGGKIVGEFLMSLGYLPGAHDKNCPFKPIEF